MLRPLGLSLSTRVVASFAAALPLLALATRATTARSPDPTGNPTGPAPAALGELRVGERASYTFRTPPLNSAGIKSLDELRGRPVLIDFWGTRCGACIAGAVPASLKLQETFGDDLHVLFVESQGASSDEAESFALARRWLGGRALWTCEAPLRPPGNALPRFVLLGNEGQVLLFGNPLVQSKDIEREITLQIQARRAVPADAPRCVRDAWNEFVRGRWARAYELLDALADDATLAEAERRSVCAARAQFDARIENDRAWVARWIEQGWLEEADDRLARLERCAARTGELAASLQALRTRLETPEMRREREAQIAIGRLLTRYYGSGGDADLARELVALAERHKSTRSAERARHAAALVLRR